MENVEPSLKTMPNSTRFLRSVIFSLIVSIITMISVAVAIDSYETQSPLKVAMEGKSYSGVYLALLFVAVGLYVIFNKAKPKSAALTGIILMLVLSVVGIIFIRSHNESKFKNSFLPDSVITVNSTEAKGSKFRESYLVSITNNSRLQVNEIEFAVRYSIGESVLHQTESIQSISFPAQSTKIITIDSEDLSRINLPDSAAFEVVITCVNTSAGNCRLKSKLN